MELHCTYLSRTPLKYNDESTHVVTRTKTATAKVTTKYRLGTFPGVFLVID